MVTYNRGKRNQISENEIIVISEDSGDEVERATPPSHVLTTNDEDVNLSLARKELIGYLCDVQLPRKEVFISHKEVTRDRKTLMTLLADNIALDRKDLSMNKGFTSHDAFEEYRFTFLSNAYECDQVFIPMNEKNEKWYLLVISLKEWTVYICDCCSTPNIHETQRESALHMTQMKFTTKLLKLVCQQNNRTNDSPNIASFVMKFPEIMRLQNKHASGLWVCSWIKNECWFPFNDNGDGTGKSYI